MTRLRIATWNMHGGVGLDGRFAPERIAQVISELDADVIALQEFGSRDAGFAMAAHLERASAARAIVMPTFQKCGSDFGNVVLTRWPASAIACHALGVDGREPRNAIDLVIDYGHGSLRVVATHLGLRAIERSKQVKHLRALFDVPLAPYTIVLGDFNEWSRRGALHEFDAHFGRLSAPATFPSPCPIVALDRIWIAPAAACIDLHTHKSRTARIASDHLPLVAMLELP
ncbi:MAG: endonuclease/exonuclease/phosphatase family protein [Dokdonella sp.]